MSNDKIEVFISYSKQDKELRDGLLAHLRILEGEGIITWHDRQIVPGTRWDEEIKARLNAADIILLLISADFLNTDYCKEVEIPEALRRHEAGEATVMPVLLRQCGWKYTPLASIQAYPEKAKPIKSWSDIDEAYTNVVDGVYLAAKEIKERRSQQQVQQERIQRERQRQAEEQERLRQAEYLRQQQQEAEAAARLKQQEELEQQRQAQLKQEADKKRQQEQSAETQVPTKVFISYSWDSEAHKELVLTLANTLRNPWGIESDVDQYVRAKPPYTPEQGWDLWMEKRIEWAEFVLIVCTETYKRRFRGDEEPGVGRGVTWEGTIIRQNLYNDQLRNTKFIPVVFSAQDLIHVPTILNGNDKYVLEDEKSFGELCYRLRKEPIVAIPDIATAKLQAPPEPKFFSPQKPSAEPPPVRLDSLVLEIDSRTLQKNLVDLQKQGTLEECREVIIKTSQWLLQHPSESYVRNQLLKLVQSKATVEQQHQIIDQTTLWLLANLETSNSYTLTEYLKLVISQGTSEQGQSAVSLTLRWLEQVQQSDSYVRRNCLMLAKDKALPETAQALLNQTYSWLSENLEGCDSYIMTAYLQLVIDKGTIEQQQKAKEQAAIWLERSDDSYVRTQYLKLLKKIG